MEHSMRLATEPFLAIKEGRKLIECRLFDEKRQKINLEDSVVFSENENTLTIIKTEVIGLLHYQTFEMLFSDNEPRLFGGTNSTQLLQQIKQFYTNEEEARYGVLGIRLRVIA
jgi:ASC-1-like (ASCH) protein